MLCKDKATEEQMVCISEAKRAYRNLCGSRVLVDMCIEKASILVKEEIKMAEKYTTHEASVVVNAPVHQVYGLFTHFNDFPKFLTFVKEVTYIDSQKSHWVAEVAGRHQWDAINENWMEDRQIGWRSTSGLDNFGKVTFESLGNNQTRVVVAINYNPPAGILGEIGEKAGVGSHFQHALEADLRNFAHLVEQAPAGALDPNASNFIFHANSAAAKGETTKRQDQTM